MRGALIDHMLGYRLTRIIPADAGSTVQPKLNKQDGQDHPRGCGEHTEMTADLAKWGGSSPRMRGALRLWATLFELIGIIPADAGSTARRPTRPTA